MEAGMANADRATEDGRLAKGKRTKAAILKEARRLMADRGFDGTSVKDITEAAGVPKSLFYHYFRGVDGLLEEILDSGSALKEAAIRARGVSRSDAKARNDAGAKDAYLARVFAALSSDPEGLRILFGEAMRRKGPMSSMLDLLTGVSAGLDEVMPEELEKGYGPKELAALRIYTRIFPVILLALTEDEVARRLRMGKAALRELVFAGLRSPLAAKSVAR
jgi:AcrR family transcriptional regulator